MENRIIFREMLTEMKAQADQNAGVITHAQIKELLKNMPLEEAHFQLIYDYLAQQNIKVVETKEELEEYPDDEEEKSLTLYAQEMLQLEQRMTADEHEVMERILSGDESAKSALIELYLPVICDMAGKHAGEGNILVEDLIQEGNLGLMEALYDLSEVTTEAECHAKIFNAINEAMANALSEDSDVNKKNQGIVSKVNHLNEAVNNLEEELGHKVSVDELSAYLEMPLAEIEDILRMSGDQIEVEPES